MDLRGALQRWLALALGVSPERAESALLRELARARMEERVPRIVRGMRAKGVTVERAGKTAVVRDALFRLWRQIIPSGDLADLVRDAQDDRVLTLVEPQFDLETPLPEIVRLTMEAALDLAF
jgi:hypothetical protein